MSEADVQLHKAIQWELAKGHLLAMMVADGHRRLSEKARLSREWLDECDARFGRLNREIKAFISTIEDQGLGE